MQAVWDQGSCLECTSGPCQQMDASHPRGNIAGNVLHPNACTPAHRLHGRRGINCKYMFYFTVSSNMPLICVPRLSNAPSCLPWPSYENPLNPLGDLPCWESLATKYEQRLTPTISREGFTPTHDHGREQQSQDYTPQWCMLQLQSKKSALWVSQ